MQCAHMSVHLCTYAGAAWSQRALRLVSAVHLSEPCNGEMELQGTHQKQAIVSETSYNKEHQFVMTSVWTRTSLSRVPRLKTDHFNLLWTPLVQYRRPAV